MFSKQDESFVTKYHLLGLILISLISISLHFTYDWLGGNALVGLFTPINESIWEHLKLVFFPLLLWWLIGYLVFRQSKRISLAKWLPASVISILISMTFIVSWYYTWVHALNVESSIIDIGSLFIAVPLGQLVAIHIYKVIEPRIIYSILSFIFLMITAFAFIWFTIHTPGLPIFAPPN